VTARPPAAHPGAPGAGSSSPPAVEATLVQISDEVMQDAIARRTPPHVTPLHPTTTPLPRRL